MPEIDPRQYAAMIRALSMNDVTNNYASGGGEVGPFNLMASGAQSNIPGQYGTQRVYGGASLPVVDGVSLDPGLFAMSEQNGPSTFQSLSPGVSLNAGPIGAMVAKNYNAYSSPDYAETSRPISFGGNATLPVGNADLSYRGIKTGDDPMRHMLGVTAPLMGGDFSAGMDANRLNRPDGAYLRWRAQF